MADVRYSYYHWINQRRYRHHVSAYFQNISGWVLHLKFFSSISVSFTSSIAAYQTACSSSLEMCFATPSCGLDAGVIRISTLAKKSLTYHSSATPSVESKNRVQFKKHFGFLTFYRSYEFRHSILSTDGFFFHLPFAHADCINWFFCRH